MKEPLDKIKQSWFFLIVALVAIFLAAQFARAQESAAPAETSPIQGAELSLDNFLDQVRDRHDDYRAALKAKHAAVLYAREAHLAVQPNLYALAQHTDDQKPNSLFTVNRTLTDTYQLGVSEVTPFGLSGKLYYGLTDLQYKGFSFGGVPPMDARYTQGSPTLELTMPLWRNWLGGEIDNQIEQGDANAASKLYLQSYKMKTVMVGAETAYWRLALARESVKISQDAVNRASLLAQWHKKRAHSGLDDRADLLAAQAALQSRLLDLKTSQDNAKSAARAFNVARGVESNDVSEKLLPLTPEHIQKLQIPERDGNRDDVKAAFEQNRAAKASAELSRQKYQPTLELFGLTALNNNDPTNNSAAVADSFHTDRPTNSVGVRFNAPLDFGLIHDVRQGWEQEKVASETTYRRKLLEQENDWSDLSDKYRQAQDRFTLYQKLEEAERAKLEYEHKRRTAGRTTTQQVLNFETDYQQAQLGRIQTLSDLLQVLAQMKLYVGALNESR